MRTLYGATPIDRTGYPDMLITYRVRVVARYAADVQLKTNVPASAPYDPAAISSQWDTSAVEWDTTTEAFGQTLTLIYDAEGRNANEAAQFARAIFECERKNAALPLPDMLAVFPE